MQVSCYDGHVAAISEKYEVGLFFWNAHNLVVYPCFDVDYIPKTTAMLIPSYSSTIQIMSNQPTLLGSKKALD